VWLSRRIPFREHRVDELVGDPLFRHDEPAQPSEVVDIGPIHFLEDLQLAFRESLVECVAVIGPLLDVVRDQLPVPNDRGSFSNECDT
jgi:hypothetical protein